MDKNDSAVVKGIAICLMVFHHLFGEAVRYTRYSFTGLLISPEVTMSVASYCKVCVALFALVSGYGMTVKCRKLAECGELREDTFCELQIKSYWNLIRDTVFLVPILVLCTKLFGFSRTPEHIWGNDRFQILWGAVTNMTGLAGFSGIRWFVKSWWYLKMAMIFIMLFPVLYTAMKKCGTISLLTVTFVVIPYLFRIDLSDDVIGWRYLPAFMLGMAMAEDQLAERMQRTWGNSALKKTTWILVLCAGLILFLYLKHRLGLNYFTQTAQAGIIALLAFAILHSMPVVGTALRVLGKHSKYIWLIHTYLYGQVFNGWLFSLRNIWLILAAVLLVSLLVSIALEKICDLFYRMLGRGTALVFKKEKNA